MTEIHLFDETHNTRTICANVIIRLYGRKSSVIICIFVPEIYAIIYS